MWSRWPDQAATEFIQKYRVLKQKDALIREGFQMSPFCRFLATIAIFSILTTNVYCVEEMPVLFLDGRSHVELPKNLFDRTTQATIEV